MNKNEAIEILDSVIPPSENKMVDCAHIKIAVAWETIKKELQKTILHEQCCMCPGAICPGILGTPHPEDTPCKLWKEDVK